MANTPTPNSFYQQVTHEQTELKLLAIIFSSPMLSNTNVQLFVMPINLIKPDRERERESFESQEQSRDVEDIIFMSEINDDLVLFRINMIQITLYEGQGKVLITFQRLCTTIIRE